MIAAVLEINSWTVSTHLRLMFAKLGVSSRAAMVARVLESRQPAAMPERREAAPVVPQRFSANG